jgi:hypothetical protein
MTSDQSGGPEQIVYIDRSDIRGDVQALKSGIRALVGFVEANEPRLLAYGFYVDEAARQMTVVAVHPDAASLVFHIEIGGAEFRKLAHLITLRSIDVYGRLDGKALGLLGQKAAALGGAGSVTVHESSDGFSRLRASTDGG